ncbi:hypothetical protein L198_07448 [Cryptococcus wingfieldii CBS 7118]|uniref:Uncharacterized protein n=1 Tax=Cryptococcus wingfieldii CBS 7118 TaxID=1295528 RepID=A0A1E3IB90_9TREE|nr:hypothetical protein L198_07448 [Cryptococcus wingfieldii CBS 7118]ODN85883.1 hypothetical protein L198_07448 [Cryptococcus wingfieldii CBS 7118]
MPYENMTHDDSTSPSLGGFGSPQEDDVISLGSSGSPSSSASAETADRPTPNPSSFEEAYSGAEEYRYKPNNSALPSSMRKKDETFHEKAAAGASKVPITGVDAKGNDQAKDDQARGKQSEFTAILHEIMLNREADKYENARLHLALGQQSKRLEDVSNKLLQQEANHQKLTEGLFNRFAQLEATLANLSNLHKQEVGRNQEFTDGLVNRVAQLETTLANFMLQKSPPDIHVDVHMPPQQASSTPAGYTPPLPSPHDEGSSDGGPQSSLFLEQSLDWTAGFLVYIPDQYSYKADIMRTFREAKSMSQSNPSACRGKICELGGHLEAFAANRRHGAWEEDVAMKAVKTLRRAL